MSTIKLNGTTSGSSIIKAPDSGSTNQTFTLPAATGTLLSTAGGTMTGNLLVQSASTGATASTDADDLVIEGTNGGISILNATNGQGNIFFGDSGDNDIGKIAYNHTANTMYFITNGGVRTSLTPDGLTFNGDTAAANALDDYEEGTWTPTLIGSGGGTGTWASSTNTYTKVGRAVHFTADLNCTSVGNASNALIIGGLPFTNASAGGYQSVVCGNATGLAIGAGNSVNAFVNINDTKMYVKLWNATTGTAAYGFYISELTADGTLMLSGTYFTA